MFVKVYTQRILFLLNYTLIDIYFVIVHTVLGDKKVKIKGFLWFDSPRYKKLSMAPISSSGVVRGGSVGSAEPTDF